MLTTEEDYNIDDRRRIMTPKQKELAEKHGTPEQFEKAIWKAYADLFITSTEAWTAIRKYKEEWKQTEGGRDEHDRI